MKQKTKKKLQSGSTFLNKKVLVGKKAALGAMSASAEGAHDLEKLEKILELMVKHEVAELDWQKQDERIQLKTSQAFGREGAWGGSSPAGERHGLSGFPGRETHLFGGHSLPGGGHALGAHALGGQGGEKASLAQPVHKEEPASHKKILSPFVGTFYRGASPDAEVYVKPGQLVKKGDVLCIIEAMKLMNEIEADHSGKLLSILVENSQPVEFGEPLFLIDVG